MPLPAVKKVRHPCALLLVLGYFYFGLLVYFKHSFYVNFLGPVVFLLQKVHAPRASFHELSVFRGKKREIKQVLTTDLFVERSHCIPYFSCVACAGIVAPVH